MLAPETKKTIQQAYSNFLQAKELKPRYGQKLMIAAIANTLGNIESDEEGVRVSEGHVCVVEAGTGTGKTVAYLLSTLPIAKEKNKKIVLSSATVALQEQVVLKDLPDLLRHSGLEFSFALAKGRGRYICLSKLDRLVSSDDDTQLIPLYEEDYVEFSLEDKKFYDELVRALAEGEWDGDRDNWPLEIEQNAWQRVTTDHRQCTGRKCSNIRNCSFFKAREQLDEVDCIVANHDLVLADLALGGGAILPAPEETIYIFDEGHHLPEKALNHFSLNTRYRSTIRWLGQSEGQWPSLLETVEDAAYFVELAAPLETTLKSLRTILETHLPYMQTLTERIDRSERTPRLRFEHGIVPEQLEILAQELVQGFSLLTGLLQKLHREIEELINEQTSSVPLIDLENIYPVLASWLGRAEASQALWKSFAQTQQDDSWPIARWLTLLEFNDQVDYELVSSPILASRALEEDLWSRCYGAVVTSATIAALNSFERFKYRAGTSALDHYEIVPSPFDFANKAVLHIPEFAIEANNAQAHTDNLIEHLPDIIDVQAASLVLFASRRQMQDVYQDLPHEIRNIILMQGSESKQQLIKKHKSRIDNDMGSVIFGLASFAEGIDLPGKYCVHVIIAKIPFAVPDDPLEAALGEWIEKNGGNAFMQISVPDAAMRLVQACGRLLRTETDSGKVTILDKRLISKRYGKAILDSLPPFSRNF